MFYVHIFGVTLRGDAATWATAIATAAIAIVALFALRQIGEVRKDRHVAFISEMGSRWDDERMVEARNRAILYTKPQLAELVRVARPDERKNSPQEERARQELLLLLRIPNFFEDLSSIARFGKIETDLIGVIFKGLVRDTWDAWQPAIAELRKRVDKFSYTQFEELNEQMKALPDE